MNAREIFIVARYEFLVISRGVVFRVLTLLALLGVTWAAGGTAGHRGSL